MNGVVLNLTPEEAADLLFFLDRAQITGAQALALVLRRRQIEAAIKNCADMAARNGTEPEPVAERET